MNADVELPNDLVLSIIHKIEEEKLFSDLPDYIYVTPQEIVTYINKNRDQLREDYGRLNLSELCRICEVDEENTKIDTCLDALCSQLNHISVLDEKIPVPLYKILERLWRKRELVIFPPQACPETIQQFLDRTCPEFDSLSEFAKEHSRIRPEQLRKQTKSLSERLDEFSNDGIRLRSKIFEIIRLLPKIRFTPQITYYCEKRYRKNPFDKLGYQNVNFIKYVQERKSLPPRSITITSFFSDLRNIVKSGYTCPLRNEKMKIKDSFDSAKLLKSIELIQKAFEDPEILGKDGAFSDFQKSSTLHIFLNLFLDDTRCNKWCNETRCRLSKKNLTIVADTGAGKTLAFITAPLIYMVYKQLKDPAFRVAQKPICILIYPRRDLAFDQNVTLQRMVNVINRITKREVRINVGCDYGGNINYNGCILTTNIEAIKRRLADPSRSKSINPDLLKLIILDEVHLYSGILGLHVIYFLRRLGAFLKEKNYRQHRKSRYLYPLMIGASATIALPEMHSQKLFSLGYESRRSKDRYRKIWVENAIGAGQKGKRALFHHIFILPKKLANLLGTLTDSTVGVLHNNPDRNFPQLYNEVDRRLGRLSDKARSRIAKNIGKSLLFVDSTSAINRLSKYISQTEKRHLQVIGANGQTRNFMTNTVYDKPLKFFPTFNIRSNGKFWDEVPKLEEISKGPQICRLCKTEHAENVSLLQYLTEGRDIGTIIPYHKKLQLITILDGCLFFKSGLCWWFSEFPFIEEHHGYLPDEFPPDATVPFRRTASLRQIMEDVQDLDELFVEFRDSPPHLRRRRLAIVSPVFEVGVDIANVRDVITFKTIRNLASYRQKTGRGGRELFSDTPVYTLISKRILDRYIYRNPDIVADPAYLDPIPLKEHNLYFLKAHIFMAIFDFLAIWSTEYSAIFHFNKLTRNPDLKKTSLLKYLDANERRIRNYVKFAFSHYTKLDGSPALIEKAIEEFRNRLELFFTDLPTNLQTTLGISKPISRDVNNVDRKLLTSLLIKSKDPNEVLQNLKTLLEVA